MPKLRLTITDDEQAIIDRFRAKAKNRQRPGRIDIRAQADDTAEILIFDVIGFDFFGDGMTAKDFAEELRALGDVKTINVRINSPGGDVFDGITIFNLLEQHPAEVIVHIDGIAASIAAVVAMAGDEIRIAENGTMMIHAAWSIVIGDAGELRQEADILEKLDSQIAGTIARRTGMSGSKVEQLMDDETWFTAAEAKAAGLVDEIVESKRIAASVDLSMFDNVPEAVAKRNAPAPQSPPDASEPSPADGADSADNASTDEAETVAVRARAVEVEGHGLDSDLSGG